MMQIFNTTAYNQLPDRTSKYNSIAELFAEYRKGGTWETVPAQVVVAVLNKHGQSLPEWLHSYLIALVEKQVKGRRGRKEVDWKLVRLIKRTYNAKYTKLREEWEQMTPAQKRAIPKSERFSCTPHRLAAKATAEMLRQRNNKRIGVDHILNLCSSGKKR